MYNLYADKPILVELFSELPENLSLCVDEKNEIIYDLVSNLKKFIIFDCSGDLKKTQTKMLENEFCFDCCNNIYNKYKYK